MKLVRDIGDYGWRVFHRFDFVCGGVLAVVYFFVADHIGLADYKGQVVASIVAIGYVVSAYAVYREERIMRAKRDAEIRLTARPASFRWVSDPDKVRLEAHISWEIWADIDFNTAEISLNIVGIRHKKWWQIFQRREEPLIGLRPKGQDTYQYRKRFLASDSPIEGDTEFEIYEGPLEWPNDGDCDLELVLKTGSPAGRYSARVDPRLWERGTRRPL